MEMQYGSRANISHQPPGGRDFVDPAVASNILQIPPSAASERNWTLFGNTHIQANLRLFEPDNEPSSTRLESDSEDEASESDVQEVSIEKVQGEDMEAWEEDNQSFSFLTIILQIIGDHSIFPFFCCSVKSSHVKSQPIELKCNS